jgi:hypothetical protein
MPIIPEIQERLLLAFPRSAYIALSRAVQEGSYLADHLINGESFLNNVIGRDIRGHIRRVGISTQIDLYCQRGDLPFVTEMKPMPRGPWHWLEIRSTGAVAHVCRTDDSESFPDEAESRQDIRLVLQANLFRPATAELGKIIREVPQLYAWVTFRVAQDGRLSHLCCCSPAADRDEWLAYINVLDEISKSGATVPSATVVPDPKEKLRLKDHIAIALEKSGDKEKK